jgi:peptide chain release factor 3
LRGKRGNFRASTTPGPGAVPDGLAKLREEGELAQAGYEPFDLAAYRHGDLTPVYFGSALKLFGVTELLDALAISRPPRARSPPNRAPISPDRPEVTGFIFKVQANMDPQHRDRIAFMRLVLGQFRRGMKLTPSGSGKPMAVHSPILFFAQDRELADEAYPGDIIGIPNHGTLRVGDTLSKSAPMCVSPACPISRQKSCAASR